MYTVICCVGGNAFAQTLNVTGVNSNCPNGTEVIATTSGLAAPVGFQLLSGSTVVLPIGGSGWASSGNFSNLPAGTYTVKVRSNNDDSTTITSSPVTTTVSYTPITVFVSPLTKTACSGETESLTVSATGGSGDYLYGITPVSQNTEPTVYQSSPIFSGLAPGSYKFWVKDNVCPSATIINTTGSYTLKVPTSVSPITSDRIYLYLQNTSTASGGYAVWTNALFRGSYIYMPADEKPFYNVYIVDLTSGINYPEQPSTNTTIVLPASANVLGHDLRYYIRNICDNSVKDLGQVDQKGPLATVTATCGIAQANWSVEVAGGTGNTLAPYPATFIFTDATGVHPENNIIKNITSVSNMSGTENFTPNTIVNWSVIDHDGKVWPSGTLDFAVDGTNGGTNLSFVVTDPDGCIYNRGSMRTKIGGIPAGTTNMAYVVTMSDNPDVPVGYTGRFVPGPYTGEFRPEFTFSPMSNLWPAGNYTLMIKTPVAGGCYDGKSMNVRVAGYKPVVSSVTKTAICGSFNFTINGNFDSFSAYELVVLSGPSSTSGTARPITSNSTTFTNMPYGTYNVAVRVIGTTGTCSLVTLDPITFTAASAIEFDGLNSGGFACGPSGKGDMVIEASTVISGATLEYSIDNGTTWQASKYFTNVNVGTYSVKIRETVCGIVTTQNVSVISTLAATINNNPVETTVCIGDIAKLNINALGGTAYNWTYPDGSAHSGKEQNLGNVTPAMAGAYTVTVSTTACTSDEQKVHLYVLDKPVVNTLTDVEEHKNLLINIPITGTPAKKYSDSDTSVDFPTTYNWTNDNPAIGLAASGTGSISFTGTNTGSVPIIANITVTPTTTVGCPGIAKTFTITILPTTAVEICNNGIDDDGDGYIDAADSDCGGTTFCNDGGGVEIINETFGSGPNFGPALPIGTTNYIYSSTNADPAGRYIITNNPKLAHTDPFAWYDSEDHTSGDSNGYMALFNGDSNTAGIFYSKTVTDLCPGVRYSFSSWIANVLNSTHYNGTVPEVVFEIRTLSNVLIGAITTGGIPQGINGLKWAQYGFSYDQPAGETAIKIIMRNNSTAIEANDLAIDDVVLKACAPTASITMSPSPIVCLGSSASFTGVVSPGYTSSAYQWQKSIDNGATWTNVAGQTALTFTLNKIALSDIAQYRLLASEASNAGSVNCASVSNVITVVECDNPLINITKDGLYTDTNADGKTNAGDTVTYSFVVKNEGNTALTNITVTDNNAVVTGEPLASLAVGASDSTTFTAIHVITQADIDAGIVYNLATVTSKDPKGADVTATSTDPTPCSSCPVDPACPTCTAAPLSSDSAVSIAKDGLYTDANADGKTNAGDTVRYSFVVKNEGNTTLTNITVTDNNAVVTGGPLASLAVGASDSTTFTAIHIITQADIDAGIVYNLATVTSKDPKGADVTTTSTDPTPCSSCPVDPACPTCTATPLSPDSAIAVIKRAVFVDENNDGYAQPGETIRYSFEIKNTGETSLTNVIITDNLPGLVLSGNPINLNAGEINVSNFSAIYTLTQGDIDFGSVTNQAIAEGKTPSGGKVNALSDNKNFFGDNPTVINVIKQDCVIEVFNAVSSNGDGINDEFHIKGLECYPTNTVEIYNRWGVKVFETSNYGFNKNVFKGYSDGRSTISKSDGLPDGTYFYILKYLDNTSNKMLDKSGYLYIKK